MVTRSEVHFPPPPRPQEPWKEFFSNQEKHSSDSHQVLPSYCYIVPIYPLLLSQASPHAFLELLASQPPLRALSSLRQELHSTEAYLPHGLLMGVITRKFHPSFQRKKDSSQLCFCSVWVRDPSDQVRVTLWEGSVGEHYSKLQEGRLLVIKGFRVRPLYQPEQQGPDRERLSPAEVSISE